MDVKIEASSPSSIANGYVRDTDLFKGKEIIYFGCDLEELEKLVKGESARLSFVEGYRFPFPSYAESLERKTEAIITHETLHIVLFSLTKSIETTKKFDNIDGDDRESVLPISNYGALPWHGPKSPQAARAGSKGRNEK